jgi:ABC-type Fe3+-hydroxamate transport system substrate-binding protein
MKRFICLGAAFALALVLVVSASSSPSKADSITTNPTYAIQTQDNSNYVITVTTSAVVTVTMMNRDYTLVHLGIQNDGSTASVSTDYAVMQPTKASDGSAITIAADYTDGAKLIVGAGASATFSGNDIINGNDGPAEVQIKAVGHGCKMMFIRGHKL